MVILYQKIFNTQADSKIMSFTEKVKKKYPLRIIVSMDFMKTVRRSRES